MQHRIFSKERTIPFKNEMDQDVRVPIFQYQQWNGYFAQVAKGVEDLCAEELAELGASRIKPTYKGINFTADRKTLYRINYRSRLASRILAPLRTFQCHSTKYLYRTAKTIQWSQFLSLHDTFAVSATVSQSRITRSKYAALCVKDAIADHFMERGGKRPNVQTSNPDIRVNLHVQNNKAVISLDTSGEALHKRGYRDRTLEAPMRETLAAAIIRLTRWDAKNPLCDPMCGSGTLVIEALMHAWRIPSGYLRQQFGFEKLPDFEPDLWKRVRKEEDRRIKPLPRGMLFGSDLSRDAVEISRQNCEQLPGAESIDWKIAPIEDITFPGGIIVCNPPYGRRIGDRKEAAGLYRKMGDILKRRCPGATAFLYIGEPLLIGELGMKPSMTRAMPNGPIDGKLCRFPIFPAVHSR
jgi:putative N6-adenine-specific DNA methylase